jgi:hypothetical protein
MGINTKKVIDSVKRIACNLINQAKQLILQATDHLFLLFSLRPCTVFLPVSRVLPKAYWVTAVSVLSTATGFSSFNLSTWLLSYLLLSSLVSEHQGQLKLATIHDIHHFLSLHRLFRQLPEKTQAIFVFLCSTASLSLAHYFLQSPVLHDIFARLSLCRLLYFSSCLTLSPKPSGDLTRTPILQDLKITPAYHSIPRDNTQLSRRTPFS